MCIGTDLQMQVSKNKQLTGEDSLLVAVENIDKTVGIHSVSFNPYLGLMVDGRPPQILWYQMAEEFHLLETPPRVLH